MSRPEPKLVARLAAIEAVTDIVGAKIFPVIVPSSSKTSLTLYPAIAYQVIEDRSVCGSRTWSNSYTAKIRVGCLGTTYKVARALADAVLGPKPENVNAPLGLHGWQDGEGSVWLFDHAFDEATRIVAGSDELEVYCINQIYTTQYCLT